MKDAPAFDFYAQRWLAGTMDMTAEERGAYINLLCRQWEDDGLADDPKRLAAVARCRPATLAAVLERFPVSNDGKRRNSRLEITRQEQRARIAKSREKIEKMNAARASCRDSTRTSTRSSCRDSTRPSSPLTTHHSPHVLLEKEPKGVSGGFPLPESVAKGIKEMYHRKEDTEWSDKEKAAARKLSRNGEESLLADLAQFQKAREAGWRFYRKDVLTLLNNWQGEIERAGDFIRNPEAPANTHQHTETLF